MGNRSSYAGFWLLTVVLGGFSGCDAAPEAPDVQPGSNLDPVLAGDPPSLEEAASLPVVQVEKWMTQLSTQAAAYEGEARGVDLARRAAALAWSLARRTGDPRHFDQARSALTEASRRKRLEGACAASNELARLEAEAGRKTVAYEVAYRTLRRFSGRADTAACIADASALVDGWADARPSDGRLALLDLDPDEDDPAAGLERGAALEKVVIYGHSATSPGPVRVGLHFWGEPTASVTEEASEDGRRRWVLEVTGGEVAEEVAAVTPVGADGLESVRLARTPTGDLRIVLDLAPGARTSHFALPDPFRFIIDVHVPTESVLDRATARDGFVVVIDPGHGGDDFGARQGTLKESQVVLDLAKRAARLIEQREPRARVFLTRHGDDFLSLEQRTAMANAAEADLFVSVHLNSADDPVARGGVTTFVLSTSEDRQALLLAARENGTAVSDVSGLQRLLAGLHRREQVQGSRALAERIQRRILARARGVLPSVNDRGVREALFYVLVGARMPAVLVEASFLTHAPEAEALKTDRYRQALGDGIAEGVLRYLEHLPSRRPVAAAVGRQ